MRHNHSVAGSRYSNTLLYISYHPHYRSRGPNKMYDDVKSSMRRWMGFVRSNG